MTSSVWMDWLMRFIIAVVAGLVVSNLQPWGGPTGWAVGGLVVVAASACLFLAFARSPSRLEGAKGPPRFPRFRAWALLGIVTIALLLVGGLAFRIYEGVQSSDKVKILVARFDGPEPERYGVTDAILNSLQLALTAYRDVTLDTLAMPVTEAGGSQAARAEGVRRNASIVIWGWYRTPGGAIPVSVHFELLRTPEYMPELGPDAEGRVRISPVAQLDSFTLQMDLAKEMAYLSLFTVGMIHHARENWELAIHALSDALHRTASSGLRQSTIYFYRGLAYANQGKLESAIADYDSAIALQPNFVQAYGNRGVVHAARGDLDRALADCNSAIALAPNFVSYYNRGLVHVDVADRTASPIREAELARAITDYDSAISLKPGFYLAHADRGLAYRKMGNLDRAIADYDTAIASRPDYAAAYNNRAIAYGNKGDFKYAIADFTRAISLQNNYAAAYNGRGAAYVIVDDFARAIADLNKAIVLRPGYVLAYNNRGNAYAASGDFERAIADFDRALALDPAFAIAYRNRGNAYKELGRLDRAAADLQSFSRLSGDSGVRDFR